MSNWLKYFLIDRAVQSWELGEINPLRIELQRKTFWKRKIKNWSTRRLRNILRKKGYEEFEKLQILYLKNMEPVQLSNLKMECDLLRTYSGVDKSAISLALSSLAIFISMVNYYGLGELPEGIIRGYVQIVGGIVTIALMLAVMYSLSKADEYRGKQLYCMFLLKCIDKLEKEA